MLALVETTGNVPTTSTTPTPTARPTPTPTTTPILTPTACDGLTITQIGGSIETGTTDRGNHEDDQVTTVHLLPFSLYACATRTLKGINVSTKGNAQFVTT